MAFISSESPLAAANEGGSTYDHSKDMNTPFAEQFASITLAPPVSQTVEQQTTACPDVIMQNAGPSAQGQNDSNLQTQATDVTIPNGSGIADLARQIHDLTQEIRTLKGTVLTADGDHGAPKTVTRKLRGLPQRRSPERNKAAAQVRQHLDTLLNNSLTPFVEAEQAENFDGADGRRCCSVYDFAIDLIGGPHSPWNISAADVFVENFLETHHLEANQNTIRGIKKCFFTRIKSIKQMTKAGGAKKVKNTRKYSDFIRRLETVLTIPSFQPYVEVLQLLGPDGMSSDESDDEHRPPGDSDHSSSRRGRGCPTFRVLTPRWRSDELTNFLHLLDSIYITLRKMDPDRQRGSWPRIRHYDPQRQILSPSKRFVPNLPMNAYSSAFLAKYTEDELKEIVKPTTAKSFVVSASPSVDSALRPE